MADAISYFHSQVSLLPNFLYRHHMMKSAIATTATRRTNITATVMPTAAKDGPESPPGDALVGGTELLVVVSGACDTGVVTVTSGGKVPGVVVMEPLSGMLVERRLTIGSKKSSFKRESAEEMSAMKVGPLVSLSMAIVGSL